MRDTHQGRCYYGMKLASWLSETSYWEDTLTHTQVHRLITRVLNHPEISGRWNIEEVDILYPDYGKTAWARKLSTKRGEISLPPGTRSHFVVLHEMAHLLSPNKRESMHGPGFIAIHLMLVDLFYSTEKAQILAAAYNALGTPVDPSRIPSSRLNSSYVPILGGPSLNETISNLGFMLASGMLTESERVAVRKTLNRLKAKARREKSHPAKALPATITIKTSALLRASSTKHVAEIVMAQLREDFMPKRMTAPKLSPKEKEKRKKEEAAFLAKQRVTAREEKEARLTPPRPRAAARKKTS